MESYVYLVLAAMEVRMPGSLEIDEDFSDPRLTQAGSGFYIYIRPAEPASESWRSASALGRAVAGLATGRSRAYVFYRACGTGDAFTLQYGVGWQLAEGPIEPFTVSVLVDQEEVLQQTSAFRLGLWRSLGTAGLILLVAQMVIFFLVSVPCARSPLMSPGLNPARPPGWKAATRGTGAAGQKRKSLTGNREIEPDPDPQRTGFAGPQPENPVGSDPGRTAVHGGEAESSMQNAVDEMSRLIATRLERAGSSARRTLAEPVPVRAQLQRILDSLQKVYSHKMIQTGVTTGREAGLLW